MSRKRGSRGRRHHSLRDFATIDLPSDVLKVHRRIVERLLARINNHVDDIVEVEGYNVDDCRVGVVSFGVASRAVYEAVERAETEGIKAGYVRLKMIWPVSR